MKTLPNTITRWEKLMNKYFNPTLYYDKFIRFIQLELEPWMFIPWDDENNCPLKYDYKGGFDHIAEVEFKKQYQAAKDRVLFDGFILTQLKSAVQIKKDNIVIDFYPSDKIYLNGRDAKSIHDLCDKVQLTPTGEKQAGL